MKRSIIIWGAGRIGRGFVADIFNHTGWHTVFADIDASLVDALNKAGKYTIHKATRDGIRVTEIANGFEAVHTDNVQRLGELFLEEGLMLDIAVHAPKLEEVADMLAPLFTLRAEKAPELPMDVMMNVNMSAPDERFVSLMESRLTGKVLEYFKEKVGVTGIFAMCISPIAPAEITAKDPLAMWNNGFYEQAIDINRLKAQPPVLPADANPRLRLTEDVEKEETRKLYTLNMAHAFACYTGLKMGLETSCDAANHPQLRKMLTGALEEASLGLIGEYGFGDKEMADWRETILALLENPYINDDLQRLGADTRRKLGAYDRLVGPARLCVKYGGTPLNLAKGIFAGLDYENDDEGTKAVRAYVREFGAEAALKHFCLLKEDDGILSLMTGK